TEDISDIFRVPNLGLSKAWSLGFVQSFGDDVNSKSVCSILKNLFNNFHSFLDYFEADCFRCSPFRFKLFIVDWFQPCWRDACIRNCICLGSHSSAHLPNSVCFLVLFFLGKIRVNANQNVLNQPGILWSALNKLWCEDVDFMTRFCEGSENVSKSITSPSAKSID